MQTETTFAGLLQGILYHWADNPCLRVKSNSNNSDLNASLECTINNTDALQESSAAKNEMPLIVEVTESDSAALGEGSRPKPNDVTCEIQSSTDDDNCTSIVSPTKDTTFRKNDTVDQSLKQLEPFQESDTDYIYQRNRDAEKRKSRLINFLTITDDATSTNKPIFSSTSNGVLHSGTRSPTTSAGKSQEKETRLAGESIYELSLDIVDWSLRQLTDLAFFANTCGGEGAAVWFPGPVSIDKGNVGAGLYL